MSRNACRVDTDVGALIHGRMRGEGAVATSALGALALSGQLFGADTTAANTNDTADGILVDEPVFGRPFTEIDFSTQHDFTTQYDGSQHFSVFFKALNLTNAAVVEHGRFDNPLLNVQEIGRTFTMGVRAKL